MIQTLQETDTRHNLQTTALKAAASGVMITDCNGVIVWTNAACCAVTGYEAAELVGQTPRLFKSGRHDASFYSALWEHLLSGKPWRGEFINRRKDGHLYVAEQTISPIRSPDGRITHFLSLIEDITARKESEEGLRLAREQLELRVAARTADLETANQALAESQERFRQVAQNIRDVFWLATPARLSIIYVSPAYEAIWGRSCESLYANANSWFEAVHPDDQGRLRQLSRRPVTETGYECDYRVIRPDGSVRWILDRAFPVQDTAGGLHRLAGIARDITQHRELEQEVLAISEREQRRIGQDLHDDLCQQLVGIEFLSKALQQQLKTHPQAPQAGEIARLIRAAIDHTRLLARGLAPIDLAAEGLMRGLETLAAQTSEIFRIECSFQCPTSVLIHDPGTGTALYRIAQEAIGNAVKHAKARKIEIRLAATAQKAVLAVKDDGVGFSRQALNPRGMGLRIMHYRAAMIGGTFVIHRQARGGTAVVCAIPLTSKQGSASANL